MADEIRLKVGELTERGEAGRGIVRIGSEFMRELGVKEGDVVEIEGSRKTAGIAVRSYPADVGLKIARMDGIMRRNCGSGVGEYVKIRKANVKEAKSVALAPAQKGLIIHISPNLIRRNIFKRPVVKGDIIVPSPVVRRRGNSTSFFEDFFGFDFESFFTPFPEETRFIVTDTNPKGIVTITDATELEIQPRAPEGMRIEERAVPTVTYEDIGGMKGVVEKVREMIELPLRHPELFERLGVEPPKGVLLHGPPGTGKTLLAKAVANESGANFISISGPEVMCVDGNTPIIINDKIKTGKEIFEMKKALIGKGSTHESYTINGFMNGLTNPSFSKTKTELIETTKVKVPYYYKVRLGTAEYKVSSNHPLLTISRNGVAWKTPALLNVGEDYVITQTISSLVKPEIDYQKSAGIKIPSKFNNKLAFLLGLIAGDGYVGIDNVTFTGKDKKLHNKFVNIIKSIFGITKFKKYESEDADRSIIYSTDLVKFLNYLGFNSGKKNYIRFLDNWLIKFDRELFASFVLGLLVTGGTKTQYSIILYSKDKKVLERISKIGFSRGFIFSLPKKHTNKWGEIYKIELNGKYNLLCLKETIDKLHLINYSVGFSNRSYEYVPNFFMRILKSIAKNHKISYGNNYKIEPYLNSRKRPTIFTLESLLKLIKTKEKELNTSETSFINLIEKFIKRKVLFDKVLAVERIDNENIMYDFGTTLNNFTTAYGHVMHNSKWYGQSEENLRKIFEEAEKNAPSIIFIDEIDSIAPKREEVTGEVERRVVSQLLTLMDGLKKRGKVIVIAATNRVNAVDPALRRGGRFDREIEVPVPDRAGRLEILKIHTRNMPLDKSVDLNWLADITYGYVGADIAALTKEAAMSALRRVLPEIKWREKDELPREVMEKLVVKREDFENALRVVEPSAMREVLVEVPKVKWEDVGDLGDVKQKLKEMVEWPLENPESFKRVGIEPPKGILLYGPPGCGKTLLARAVASESGANFISIKGPQIYSKWLGESEKQIRDIFRRAKQVSPTIIFFDEIDALAPRRGSKTGTQVTETVVSQLLSEMSGLEELHGVVVMAATNRPDMIDPALLRPGRFDRFILVPPPNEKARLEILKIHTKNMPLKGVDLKSIAKRTEGFSGADLAAVCREAGMNALRKSLKSKEVTAEDFEEALKNITPSLTQKLRKHYDTFEQRRKKIQEERIKEEQPTYIG